MTHPAIVDDDGTTFTGTVWNNAYMTALDAAIDAAIAGAVSGTTLPTTTGNITAEPLPTTTGPILVTFHNNATLKTIQGMAAGTHGQLWVHYSKGAGQVDFAHQHASGTALGKLRNHATSGPSSLAAGTGAAVYQYDSGVVSGLTAHWRLVTHEQGALISPAWVAGGGAGGLGGTAFAGSAGTWTVEAADVAVYAYRLDGRNLKVWFALNTTSVASPGSGLNISLPAGFVAAAKTYNGVFTHQDNGATHAAGLSEVNPGGVIIRLLKFGFTNWTAATNATAVVGMADLEVA